MTVRDAGGGRRRWQVDPGSQRWRGVRGAATVARLSWASQRRKKGGGEEREGGRAGRWENGPAGRMREREGGTKNWLFFFQNNFPTSFSNSFWNHFEFWIKTTQPNK